MTGKALTTTEPRPLTEKQDNFCILVANGERKYVAYLEAYKRDYTPAVAGVKASQLLADPRIKARIEELKAIASKPKLTLGSHLDDLLALRNRAVQMGLIGSAIVAEIARGKASGVAVDKSEVTHTFNPLPSSVDDFV